MIKRKYRRILLRILTVGGLWIMLTLVFGGALMAVFLIDNESLRENVLSSRNQILGVDRRIGPTGHWYDLHRPDTYTDNLILSLTYEPDHPGLDSVTYRAFCNDVRQRAGSPVCGEELRFPMAESVHADEYIYKYSRYWHGYQVVVRPFLTVVDYEGIGLINTFLAIIFGGWFLYLIWRKVSPAAAIFIFVVFLLYMGIWVVPQCMQLFTCFILTFLTGIVVLTRRSLSTTVFRQFCTFFVVGAVTVYFDFLTTPLLTLGVPLALILVANPEDPDPLRKTIAAWTGWGIGYGGLWVTKWIIAGIVGGDDIIGDAMNQVGLRINHSVGYSMVDAGMPVIIMFLVLMVCAMLVWAYWTFKRCDRLKPYTGLLLTACLPVLWTIIIRNHTFQHHWFTWRQTLVTVVCLGLFILQYIHLKSRNKSLK